MSAETAPPEPPAPSPDAPGATVRVLRFLTGVLFSFLLPAAVIWGAVAGGRELMATPPRAQKRTVERRAPLVAVRAVRFEARHTTVTGLGTVVPSRVVDLRPRVAGEVVETGPHLVAGGRVKAGELLVRLDDTDFALAERQREAELARVEAALRLEEGRREVARREFELMGQPVTPEEKALLLREPQLASARAEVEAARAALERARTDRGRCVVLAPFDARVRSYEADLGTQVSTASRIAILEAVDRAFIEVSVPLDRLADVRLPGPGREGATAVVRPDPSDPARVRAGRVLRLLGDIEASGRMARVQVEVLDPLPAGDAPAGTAPLLFGAMVRVDIEGPVLPRAAALERSVLRDGDRVWVVDADDRLHIRDLVVAHRDRDCVLVTGGLEEGDRIVVTDLASPVEGMTVRTEVDGTPPGCGGTEPADDR